jgi:predicted ATPase
LLTRLVDKSLVVVDNEFGEQRRYRMLETVRQYVLERLNEMGETETVRTAHLEALLNLSERRSRTKAKNRSG